jgi:rhomboid protease GluP
MEKYLVKVKHIVPTLIYMLIGTIGITMLARWITFQTNILELKESIWSIWIPLILPWIPIIIWLRPRLRILIRKKESDKLQFFFQFITWFALGIPLFISQAYLNTALGEMANINNVEEISAHPKAVYYTIKDFVVVPKFGTSAEDVRASGKYNEHLEINLYFTLPIANVKDSVSLMPKYPCWYGVKYHRQISNKISPDEKEAKYQEFYKECIDKMRNYKYHDLKYFRRLPKSDDRDGFLKAIGRFFKGPPPAQTMILEPKTDSFEDRNGNKLAWTFGSMAIGLAFFLFCLIFPRYSVTELEHQHQGKKPQSDDIIDMLKYMIPKEPHFATSVILDINILVCLIMILSGVHILYPNGIELMEWGANRRYETTHGEWWRLVSSMFVHGGVVHLLFNIFGLVFASAFLEAIIGAKKFAMTYLVSGLVASFASILWHENTASVGASGAIFGLFGLILSFLITDMYIKKEMKRSILIMFGPYIAINLLFGLAGAGIDNAAHIGGLVSGFAIGLMLYMFSDKEQQESIDA